MAYLPPVVARLSFDLGDLSAKIDEAKAKIKSLGDTVHIKTDIDNGTLKQMAQDMEAIHRMMGRNQAIRERVDLDDADAKARLALLTRDRRVHVKVDVDKSGLSQLGGIFGKVDSLTGKLFGAASDFPNPRGPIPGGLAGLGAIAAAVPAAAALLTELAGLASGFAAAGAGAAAFYALAHPAINNLTQDAQGLDKANYKLGIAQNAYKLDPSKTNLKALIKAQDEYNATLKQMGQDAGPAAVGLMKLRGEYQKITTAFQPKAFEVLGSGIKLIADNLPKLTPFANTFADSMSKWLNNLDKASKSKGFQNFLDQFHKIEGPALQAITAGIGNVAGSIGRLLTVMSGKDVAHTINIAFSAISGTIGGITTSVKFLMNAFDGMKLAGHNIASSFDEARHKIASILAGIGHDAASIFKTLGPGWFDGLYDGAKSAGSKVVSFFSGLPGKIKGAFAGAAGWLVSAGAGIIQGLLNGAKSIWGSVAGWFGSMAGKIKGFAAGAGGWLVSAGEAIMGGLLSGIESAWGKVASFLSSLAGKIKSLKGPLDYDRVMLYPHGQAIMQGLMHGMGSQVPALESQLRGITNMISSTGGAHHSAAGTGEPIHVHVHLDGREIYSAVQARAVSTQRRTGHNGMTKRTR